MNDFRNKWLFVGSLGAVFFVTLGFSYGPGYGGNSPLAFLGSNFNVSPKMSPSNMVTQLVTVKKLVTNNGVTSSVSPKMSPSIYNNPSPSASAQLSGSNQNISLSPIPSNILAMTPTPSVIKSMSPSGTPIPTVSPSSSVTNQPLATSILGAIGPVVISEIGWMGTKASQYAEWIELYNTTNNSVDLSGWKISEGGSGTIVVTLIGLVESNGWYLVERVTPSSPHAFSDITANISSSFGGSGLSNSGEKLILQDSAGNNIDVVDGSAGWYGAGKSAPSYDSMERIDSYKSGSDPTNWASNNGITSNKHDIEGNLVNATPGSANSVSVH